MCYVRRVLGISADAKQHLYTVHSNLWPVVVIALSAWPGRGQETHGASSPAMALGSLPQSYNLMEMHVVNVIL